MTRILGVLAAIMVAGAAQAADVSLVPQGLYVERDSNGALNCAATDRMRLELALVSMDLQDLGTTQLERSESGIARFDTGAGEFMEVTIVQAVIAFTPMTRSIALQGSHMSGGLVHFNGQVTAEGDIDLQSARRLVGESDLTTYIMPQGQPPAGQRPDGSPVGTFGHCPGVSF